MILKTPVQAEGIENSKSIPIRHVYADYEETFVILHPFLKVKNGHTLRFDVWKRPTKNEIFQATLPISWSEVVAHAGLKDIKELDGLLSYLHCGRFEAKKEAWLKFMAYIDMAKLRVPQVDDYPSVLINPTLAVFKSLGYEDIFIRSDVDDLNISFSLPKLIETENEILPSCARLLTPDKKILLATDSDMRFSYLSSDKATLKSIIDRLDLEGFFCNSTTQANWSYELLIDNKIDWHSPERKKR
jgi:hypothetical protein